MTDDGATGRPTTTADGSADESPTAAEAPARLAGPADQSRSGGLGRIIGAILRGIAPTVTRTVRRTTRRSTGRMRSRGTTSSGSSGGSRGSSGTLLALHYHDGSRDQWATARVAFGRRGNRIAVISSSDASWWRHIRTASPVQVRVRNAWVDGAARQVSRDDDTYAKAVGIFIEDHSRAAAERLGVPMDEQGRLIHGDRKPGDAVVIWIEVDAG